MEELGKRKKEVTGLKAMTLCQGNGDGTHFDVVYLWEREENRRNYLEMDHFKVFRGALEILCK